MPWLMETSHLSTLFALLFYVLGCFSHSRIQSNDQSDLSIHFAHAHFVRFVMPWLMETSHLSTLFVCVDVLRI